MQKPMDPHFKFPTGSLTELRPFATWFAVSLLFVCGIDSRSTADDWPQYRGPARNGISAEKNLLIQWPAAGPTTLWKSKVGLGFSSIVCSGGRVATVGHDSDKDTVFCFDALTGKNLWKLSYTAELGDKYFEGGTTGSPTFEGDRLYWLSRWGDLYCVAASDGKVIWNKNIVEETHAKIPTWGYTGAPIVHGKLLLLNIGESGLAVEKETGKVVWQSSGDTDAGYSTPLLFEKSGTWFALVSNGENYVSVNANTGEVSWRLRWVTEYGVNAADPIIKGDQVFVSTGYGKGATLVNVGSGKPEPVWKSTVLRTQLNPAILVDGFLYGVDGDTTAAATLKCVEWATGAEKWAQPNFGSGGVLVADKNLIALSGKGELTIGPATPSGFKPTSRAQVLGGKCWTAPIVANGIVYCRNSRGDLVALDLRKN